MLTGRTFKLHQSGKQQMISFRVDKFGFIRISFTRNRNFSTLEFPIIEVRSNGVSFCRHLKNGVSYSKKKFPYSFTEGTIYDFFMVTKGTEVKFGILRNGTYKTIGFFNYLELDSLPYVGFSSELDTIWIIENGEIDPLICLSVKYFCSQIW